MFDRIVVTCEHARNGIPARYRGLFASAGPVLDGHRGSDLGALPVARALARSLGVGLHAGQVSRLLVDLNRSPGHPALFSEYTRRLDREEKELILERYYRPYRGEVEGLIGNLAARCRVLHLGIHSFTPVLGGEVRHSDVGLLYDPARRIEREACRRLVADIRGRDPGLRVRRNYPYRGTADGLSTWLRRALAPRRYAGIEVELNQELVGSGPGRRRIAKILEGAVREIWPG